MKSAIQEFQPVLEQQQQMIRQKLVQRTQLDRELSELDERIAFLQVFLEELSKAERNSDEAGIKLARRSINELLAPPTRGPIDYPLDFKPGRSSNGKYQKPRRRSTRVR